MNLFAIRKQVDKILHPVVSGLARIPLNANQWTLLGAFVGLACGVAFLYGKWWIGLALLLVTTGLHVHLRCGVVPGSAAAARVLPARSYRSGSHRGVPGR